VALAALQALAFERIPTVEELRSRGELPTSGAVTLYRLKGAGLVDVCEVPDASVVEWHRLPDSIRVARPGEFPSLGGDHV
jgi:hypothetical protein